MIFIGRQKVAVGDSLCLKRENTLYASDRLYEATGRGGLLIMPELNFADTDFEGQLPMYRWDDFADLEGKIRFYLEDADFNQEVRKKTQAITAERHTYVNRVQELLEVIGRQ
jgi:spore maturation protein CgeB